MPPNASRLRLKGNATVHHSDRGSQYLSIKYTERLTAAEIDPSVGTVGDSYDNALAESVIGLFKTEVIKQLGPWKSLTAVEWETLRWVDWYNNRRLLSSIGYIPPAEAERRHYEADDAMRKVAWPVEPTTLRATRGASDRPHGAIGYKSPVELMNPGGASGQPSA